MPKHVTIISNARDCFIEVIHPEAAQANWIVRRWKKGLVFKKRISSDWFLERQQAFEYAKKLQKQCEEKQQ
jgi:hypothetical protein